MPKNKQTKAQEAHNRKLARAKLSSKQQLAILADRPGHSAAERSRLTGAKITLV